MRIIVKVGTNVLADLRGKISPSRVRRITEEIFLLWAKNHELILVSSGAIATGRGLTPDLKGSAAKQVWAAVGQPVLMRMYGDFFSVHTVPVGQCLLLRNDFTDRERYENSIRTIEGLLSARVLPIINENDVVAMEDLTVGDNDLLAAMLAVALNADKLILLTNQQGLYTANPERDKLAALIPEVKNVDKQFERMFTSDTSSLGRGGILSKVRAAKQAVHAGIETYIADGNQKGVLEKIAAGKPTGTRFIPFPKRIKNEQQAWLMSAKGFGELIIDEGAARALKGGKSLLLPGILAFKGLFEKGQVVEVLSRKGQAIAYGKVNYGFKEIQKALEERKRMGKNVLEREVIHRDYMVVLKS